MASEPPSREFWNDSYDRALRCLEHPFVMGLADGTLPSWRYAAYMAQDAFFLRSFARAYALGIARAPDPRTMSDFLELLGGVFDELRLHEQAAATLGISLEEVRPAPATLAYTDFLIATAFSGSIGELLAAMTPCMRLYAFLGRSLFEAGHRTGPYADWITSYGSADFQRLAEKIERLLDRHALGTPEERDRYRRAMSLEHRFFDAAWRDKLELTTPEAAS